MELGLELKLELPKEFMLKCFYPCFNGIRVGTETIMYNIQVELAVSILVLMELGLELRYTWSTNRF